MDQRPNYYAYENAGPAAAGFRAPMNQREEDEVDLMEIIRVLAHHAWIIVLAALIGALLVGVAVKLFVPAKYTANATIYVFSTDGETNTQVLNQADKMTTDFQIIATTRTTLNLVIEELGLNTTVEELKQDNTIRVTNPTDSHMLRISVTNEDPAKLIVLLGKAKEEMPDNASLYYVEGDIYGRLKDYDNAVASYRKAGEINPQYEMGYYGEGVMWYNRALALQEEANALPYSEYKKYDQLQEELKTSLKKAIEPFEKCYVVSANDAVKTNVADYLKRIYFIFRQESPEYQAAYEKYDAILKAAN